MRKSLAVWLIVIALVLTGCGKSKEVKSVEKMISGIGTVELSDEEAIKDAETTYEGLSDEDKESVENYGALVEARSALDLMKAGQVDNMITQIDVSVEGAEIQLGEANDAYLMLTDSQKQLTENHDLLEAKKTAYLIAIINIDDENAAILIEEANNAYGNLTEDQKGLVSNYELLNTYLKEIERRQRNQATIEELTQAMNRFQSSTVTDKEEIASALRNIDRLYGSLDEDYKASATVYKNRDTYMVNVVIASVKSLAKDYKPLMATVLLKEYKEYLNENDLLSCLGDIGFYDCISDALSELQRYNSGVNYKVNNVNAKCTDESGDKVPYKNGENQVEGTINVTVESIFGGSFKQDINLFYTFNINVDSANAYSTGGFTF